MRDGILLAIGMFVLMAMTASVLLSSEGSEAADIDVFGDWVITGGIVQETDKSIDVRGNVIVQAGGVLKLYGCTLDINASSNGQHSLDVQSGGRLEAYNTRIQGNDAYVDFWFRDDVVLEGCQLSHVNGVGSGGSVRGIMVTGSTVTMTDTLVTDCRYHGIYAQASLNLDNVTVEDVDQSNVYMSNWGASAGDFSVAIRDCTFHLSTAGGWWGAGVYFGRWGGDPDMDLTLSGSTFDGGSRGVYISGGSNSDVVIDGCEFVDCDEAIAFSGQTTSGSYTISNNHINAHDLADSVGFTLALTDDFMPTLTANTVEHVQTAYDIDGPWTGSATTTLEGLVVENCTRGVFTDRTLHLTIVNSTFTHMVGSLECFVADGGSTITIRDTDHPWGSGTVANANSWIRAYIDIGIRGAKWRSGGPIASGELVLENVTHYEVARFNLSSVHSQDMVGWEVTDTDRRTSLNLYPVMYARGHGFRGDRIDLRTYEPSIIELVDDYVPSITINSPREGKGFNTTTVLCGGSIDELGSGTDMVQYSFNGANYTPLTSWTGSTWSLPMTSLPQGEHTLSLRPKDKVGNLGEVATVSFWVDTVVPFITVAPHEELVNTSTVMVGGSTEPGVGMTINGVTVIIAEDGGFLVELDVSEGHNVFTIEVLDKAGNYNSTRVTLQRDMTPPPLAITGPPPDVWTNAHNVYVEGTAEEGADLTVNGEPVEIINGSYRRRIDLEEGDFVIRVTCTDRAGNVAVKTRLVRVDWTPPGLTIVEPETSEVYVRESTVYISADVDDPTIDHVTVNEQSIPLTSGRFVKQFTVLEGVTEFVITVVDAADNSVTERVVVIRDLTPPTYEWNMSAVGGELVVVAGDRYCTSSAVEVSITASELSTFSLAGGIQLARGTRVQQRFDLVEGPNTLEIYIVDVAGNQAQTFKQRVEVDTTPPTISISTPPSGYRTKEDVVTIQGSTDEGTTLKINGETVTLGSGGSFRHVMALVDGRNEFTIEAVDAMGNSETATLSVLRDSEVVTEETSTTGATVTGFVLGLVVGIVLMVAFTYVRARGGAKEPPEGPRPPERDRPGKGPATPYQPPPGPGEPAPPEGWEEY